MNTALKIIAPLIVLGLTLTGCTPSLPQLHNPTTFTVIGDTASTTWVTTMEDTNFSYAGGWLRTNATLKNAVANVRPIKADVLIVLIGGNDLTDPSSVAERIQMVNKIVERSQVSRVVLTTVPPSDVNPQRVTEWNQALFVLANDHHWYYSDPWGSYRTADGHYLPGMSDDGVHPTSAVVDGQGEFMGWAVLNYLLAR